MLIVSVTVHLHCLLPILVHATIDMPKEGIIGKKIKATIQQVTIFLNIEFGGKLATDDQSDKKFSLTSKLCPLGALCPLPRGYIHVLNHEKNV